jgi:hypothetical protein
MTIFWVFDAISPFSYLSFKELSPLPAGIEVECFDLFAGLLNHHGQIRPAEIASKR